MIKYDGLSVDELLQARSDIETELSKRTGQLERQLLAIKSGASSKQNAPSTKPKTSKAPAQKKSGAKVAAMYRNPITGEEWSGRGRPARWLAAEIATGKSKEDFLIRH